jgi:hypothetical protein
VIKLGVELAGKYESWYSKLAVVLHSTLGVAVNEIV